jgi:mannose-6-phosphate isomerase-like protein (cupin superfamily)
LTERLLRPGRFPAPVDAAAVAADWADRGFDCRPFTDPPGRTWTGFVHRTNEVVTVIDGRLELTVGEETVTVGPGDEAFIPKGARHSVRNVHSGTTNWLFGYD